MQSHYYYNATPEEKEEFLNGLIALIKKEGNNYVCTDNEDTLSDIADDVANTIQTNLIDILPDLANKTNSYPNLLEGLTKVLQQFEPTCTYSNRYIFDAYGKILEKIGKYIWSFWG